MLNGKKEYGILMKANGEITVEEVHEPLYVSVGEMVGGHIEHIKLNPRDYGDLCLICDVEFLLKEDRPDLNVLATMFYGAVPILGDVVLMKDGYREGEPDIVGFGNEQAEQLARMLREELEAILISEMYKDFRRQINVDELKPELNVYAFEFDDEGNVVLEEKS